MQENTQKTLMTEQYYNQASKITILKILPQMVL